MIIKINCSCNLQDRSVCRDAYGLIGDIKYMGRTNRKVFYASLLQLEPHFGIELIVADISDKFMYDLKLNKDI